MPESEPDCNTCKNSRTISVLGWGGDYETTPCPTCRPKGNQKHYREAVDAEAE